MGYYMGFSFVQQKAHLFSQMCERIQTVCGHNCLKSTSKQYSLTKQKQRSGFKFTLPPNGQIFAAERPETAGERLFRAPVFSHSFYS